MPRLEKWLTDVSPDAPVSRAVKKAMKVRLKAVEHYLQEAGRSSGKSKDSAEAVHQLRIWTRRSSAALRLFAEVVPRRTAKWLKRKLKKVRRTASEARDCDVLAERLEKGDLEGLSPTAVDLRERRERAIKRLANQSKKLLGSGKLDQKKSKLLKKLGRREPGGTRKTGGFGRWCRAQLVPLRDELVARAEGDLSRSENLHQFRIAGKRLRYALELAPAALPAVTHRRLYDELSDLQDRLGHVCDLIAAADRLESWLAEASEAIVRKQLRDAIERQKRQLLAAKQGFLRWWSAKQRAALRRSWHRALRSGSR